MLKALSEIDNRLNVIDQVSVQLEQDHKRNQELLETIIQLNKGQNKSNSPSQLDNSTRIFKTSLLNAEKPLNDQSVPDMKIYSNDCTNLSSARQQTKSLKGNQRSRSTSGHYSEECEKARKERREVSVTRRCNEAKKFVNEILSESNLPIQSSPSLSSRPTTARTPSTTTPRGRGRVRIGGSSRVSTSRPTSKNCTAAFSPKPPTVVRSTTCGRGGIRARGAYNTLTDRRNQTDILQKPSIMGKPQSSSPGHPTFEDDLQTTILSDWSLESDVKRILYGDEEMRFHSPSKVQSICGDSNSYQECPVPQSPHSVPETDLLTEVGGVPSTSFIDWDEIDELIGAV
ncbi:unnamed protein product [Heterobilharzia americana]|nr:unnamed protein product [Heterobilharzia americana]